MRGKLIVELGELQACERPSVNTLKPLSRAKSEAWTPKFVR